MDSLLSGFVLKRRHTIKSCKRQKQYERYYMYHSRSSITRVSIRNTHLYLWINLADLLDTSGFVQHVSGATHVRGNTLDFVTAKTYNLLTTPVSPTTLFTDYYALECDLEKNVYLHDNVCALLLSFDGCEIMMYKFGTRYLSE